jgi:hypothetical protein
MKKTRNAKKYFWEIYVTTIVFIGQLPVWYLNVSSQSLPRVIVRTSHIREAQGTLGREWSQVSISRMLLFIRYLSLFSIKIEISCKISSHSLHHSSSSHDVSLSNLSMFGNHRLNFRCMTPQWRSQREGGALKWGQGCVFAPALICTYSFFLNIKWSDESTMNSQF